MKKNSQNFENESAVELKKILTYQQLEEPIKKQDPSLADIVKDLKRIRTVHYDCAYIASNHINDGETILIYANDDLLMKFA